MKPDDVIPKLTRLLGRGILFIIKLVAVLIGREVIKQRQTAARTKAMANQQAQARMNEFLAILSHELRTPLTSIKGNVQLIVRRLKTNENLDTKQINETQRMLGETRDLLERTDQQIARLTRLVHNLLESARINANSMDLLFELCELTNVVREVVQDTRHVPSTRTTVLDIPEEQAAVVMADVNRIRQVIIHYLANAHKYSDITAPIEIRLQIKDGVAHFSVSDQGPGIAPHEQPRIWDKFYRAPDITVMNGSEVGLGLGLHISRTIIELHQGQVGVDSNPGEGSVFWFTLPLFTKDTALF